VFTTTLVNLPGACIVCVTPPAPPSTGTPSASRESAVTTLIATAPICKALVGICFTAPSEASVNQRAVDDRRVDYTSVSLASTYNITATVAATFTGAIATPAIFATADITAPPPTPTDAP
jgi:hypothetical protein